MDPALHSLNTSTSLGNISSKPNVANGVALEPQSPVQFTAISPASTNRSATSVYGTASPPGWQGGAGGQERIGSGIQSRGEESQTSPRKKQKRNKPTLSCEVCVERKTKCDRGRPNCIACIKRKTECRYALAADLIEESTRPGNTTHRVTKPPKKKHSVNFSTSPDPITTTPRPDTNAQSSPVPRLSATSTSPTTTSSTTTAATSSSMLLTHVPPFSSSSAHPSASNVFGIGSEHPFANYWTCSGGLAETISVLPSKPQADALLNRYFECVDPIYPMLHRRTFTSDYETFMSLPPTQQALADGALVALIFAMLAMGSQFVISTPPAERQQTAEFYVSAAHQSLRMSSYLNKASTRSIAAMVLITYFLINDNHASDGWAFAGILLRQAYAMGLHRDPNLVCPAASKFEKQMRRKLWQAVLLQDTFLTVLLKLPPSATHTDVNVEDLTVDVDADGGPSSASQTDIEYIRGCWTLANLVQESICSPRSLDLPLATSPRQKSKLVSDFRSVYRSFPDVFRSWEAATMRVLWASNKRLVRQTLFLTSNYFHNVMLLHEGSCPSKEVLVNKRGVLEAAHEAIGAFFLLWELFENEAKVWWVFNHRAFLEAMAIGNILRDTATEPNGPDLLEKDALYLRAKSDITRMIQILHLQALALGPSGAEVARSRIEVLAEFLPSAPNALSNTLSLPMPVPLDVPTSNVGGGVEPAFRDSGSALVALAPSSISTPTPMSVSGLLCPDLDMSIGIGMGVGVGVEINRERGT